MVKREKFVFVGRLLPKKLSNKAKPILKQAGILKSAQSVVGAIFVYSLFFAIFGYVLSSMLVVHSFEPDLISTIVTIVFLVGTWAIAYIFLILRVDARKKQIEQVLPDFLQLAAANVRAGLSVDRALWMSARPEFGLLSVEVERVAKKTFGGEEFEAALGELSTRFDSRLLLRANKLIIEGISSGGEMADLLEKVAWDLRNMQSMQKEIAANVMMYVMFILFAACIGAPILFSLSMQLIVSTAFVWSQVNVESMGNVATQGMALPLSLEGTSIKADDFFWFALAAVTITTGASALIISTIQKGSAKDGFKSMPFFIILGISIFLIANWIMGMFFAGLIHGAG